MSIEQFEQQLINDGYSQIMIHEDPPDREYPDHDHPIDTAYVVVEGTMVVRMDGTERTVKQGERLDIGKNVMHWAKIGSEGCKFLIGVRM